MPKTYRAIQQWNNWLTQSLGMSLMDAEFHFLQPLLQNCYGKHSLLLGVPEQHSILNSTVTPFHTILSPMINKNKKIEYIESEFYELPIHSGSIDIVIVPHTLEYLDNPRKLLTEACRIVKPEGYIVVLGFNPYSLWGLKKLLTKQHHVPWTGNFIRSALIKNWLVLADFELKKNKSFLFRPPLHNPSFYKKLKLMEWIGNKSFLPLGGVYVLIAQAKVIPLTPIRMHWKQQLSNASLGRTIPGPTMRDF